MTGTLASRTRLRQSPNPVASHFSTGPARSSLAKAFRGELVPQDPTDEPASVLLDRIRAERAAAEPAKDKKAPRRPR